MLHITFMEAVCAAAACYGLPITWINASRAEEDCIFVDKSGYNGNRKLLARRNLRVENVFFQIELILAVIGVVSFFYPPPPFAIETGGRFYPTLVRSGLAYIAVIVARTSTRNKRERGIVVATRKDEGPRVA